MQGTIPLTSEQRDTLRAAIIRHFGSIPGVAEQIAILRKHESRNRADRSDNRTTLPEESVDKQTVENVASQIRRFLRGEDSATSRDLTPNFLRDLRVVFAEKNVSLDDLLEVRSQAGTLGNISEEVPRSLRDLILRRDATKRSLEVNSELEDRIHHYTLFHRIDHLDYPTKDFFSIRRLAGRNDSNQLSPSLLYRECSENKLRFEDFGVQALDLKTGQKLRVEPENSRRDLEFAHPFRVYFNEPLRPGQDFDIVYNIRLPRELEVVPADDEIMSVSLRRMILGVDKLIFEVCLSFKPSSILPACLMDNRRIVVPKTSSFAGKANVSVSPWERNIGLKKWSCSKPWRVSLTVEAPEQAVYIINYKR